jgi:hypothetical protein
VIADHDDMVKHDTVVVVDDLGLVAELDRFAEPAFGDRAGIRVVQRHDPRRARGSYPRGPLAGLRRDAFERGGDGPA